MSFQPSTRAHRHRPAAIRAIGLASALALAILTTGCPMDSQRPDASSAKPTRPIEDVLRDHTTEIMAIEGVVGLYQTVLDDGTPCLRVMVVKRTPELEKRIPKRLEGYRVEIDETGVIRPLSPGSR